MQDFTINQTYFYSNFRYSDIVCDDSAFKEIAFESIFTAFVVLSFGIGVAMLSVIFEKFWNKPEKPKRNSGKDVGKVLQKRNLFFLHLLNLEKQYNVIRDIRN